MKQFAQVLDFACEMRRKARMRERGPEERALVSERGIGSVPACGSEIEKVS